MSKWTLVTAQTFRKTFAPILLMLLPQHTDIWFVALFMTVCAGIVDVIAAISKAMSK